MTRGYRVSSATSPTKIEILGRMWILTAVSMESTGATSAPLVRLEGCVADGGNDRDESELSILMPLTPVVAEALGWEVVE